MMGRDLIAANGLGCRGGGFSTKVQSKNEIERTNVQSSCLAAFGNTLLYTVRSISAGLFPFLFVQLLVCWLFLSKLDFDKYVSPKSF